MSALSEQQVSTMLSQDSTQLEKNNNKRDLVALVNALKHKVDELQSYQLVAKRVEMLEKNMVSNMQYNRRESIEIHSIPQAVEDKVLEEKCLTILEDIGVGKVKPHFVHACHRLKNKDKTIIRFVTRKTADSALHHRGKLRNFDPTLYDFPPGTQIYINENLCPPMQYLMFLVRNARKQKKIASYNLWKGKITIQFEKDGRKIEIGHIQDLINSNLADESDREKFIS